MLNQAATDRPYKSQPRLTTVNQCERADRDMTRKSQKQTEDLMKFLGIFVLSLVLIYAFTLNRQEATLEGSGKIATETRTIPSFHALDVNGSIDVFLKKGNTAHLEVQAEDNVIEFVKTQVKQGCLYIDLDTSGYYGVNTKEPIKVFMTAPHLTTICSNGSGYISSNDQWPFENMDISVNGSGNVTLSLKGQTLRSSLRGSGTLSFDGMATHQEIQIFGSGDYNSQALESETAFVRINGSGSALLNVKNLLTAHIYGSGDVRTKGNPKIHSQIYGSGSIKKF